MTRAVLHIDELVEHWTILDEERDPIAGKRGATRLGFVILLKFYTQHGRFPRGRAELPDEVVEHVAKQVKVTASELGFHDRVPPQSDPQESGLSHLHGGRCGQAERVAGRQRGPCRASRRAGP